MSSNIKNADIRSLSATVKGVIVREEAANSAIGVDKYLILWSHECNHSYIYLEDIYDNNTRKAAQRGVWVEYQVISQLLPIDEKIETRAVDIRLLTPSETIYLPKLEITKRTLRFTGLFKLSSKEIWNDNICVVQSINNKDIIPYARISKNQIPNEKSDRIIEANCVLDITADLNTKVAWCINAFVIKSETSQAQQRTESTFVTTAKSSILINNCKNNNQSNPNIDCITTERSKLMPIQTTDVKPKIPSLMEIPYISAHCISYQEDAQQVNKTQNMRRESFYRRSAYTQSIFERQNTVQRHHHLAALRQYVIQKTSTTTGIASQVHSALPFSSLEKEVIKTKVNNLEFEGLVVREVLGNNGIDKVYRIYSSKFLEYKEPHIHLLKDAKIKELEVGSWYRFHLVVDDVTADFSINLIDCNDIENIEPIEDPPTVLTFTWDVNNNKESAFIICRANHRLHHNRSFLENPCIGRLHIPDDCNIEKYIDFSVLKECIVEAIPERKNGFRVVRFHSVAPELPKYAFPAFLGSHILFCMHRKISLDMHKAGGIGLISKDCIGYSWLLTEKKEFYMEIDEFHVNPNCIKEITEEITEEEMNRDLYQPDLMNNSNESLYKDVDKERPDGRANFKYVGLVMSINKKGIVFFVPLATVNKVFCHKNIYEGKKCNPSLGDWFSFHAQRRRERESDSRNPPVISHIVVSDISKVNIHQAFNSWKQRNVGGIFEFLFTATVSPFQRPKCIPQKELCLVESDLSGIYVLIPRKRLDEILNKRVSNNENEYKRKLQFWVTICQRVPLPNKSDQGISLQVLDTTPIEEILPDGQVVSLGIERSIPVISEAEVQEEKEKKKNTSLLDFFKKNPDFFNCFKIFSEPSLQGVIATQNLHQEYIQLTKELQKIRRALKE